MEEYIIVSDSPSGVQKKLNQWRHEYDIEVIAMTSPTVLEVCILLKRTRKE